MMLLSTNHKTKIVKSKHLPFKREFLMHKIWDHSVREAMAIHQLQPYLFNTEETELSSARKHQHSERQNKIKPLEVLKYIKEKIGIDISDQIESYKELFRKSIKWYRIIASSFLLGTLLMNAWIVYCKLTGEKNAAKTIQRKNYWWIWIVGIIKKRSPGEQTKTSTSRKVKYQRKENKEMI